LTAISIAVKILEATPAGPTGRQDHVGINRRQTLGMFAGLGVASLAAGCTDHAPDPAEIGESLRIGLVAPRSGPLQVIGEQLVNGFQLYLDQHDRRLGGYPVELVVVDEGDNNATGADAVGKLIDQGVLCVAGIANSAVLVKARTRIERGQIPVLAANGIPEKLQGATYIWSTSYAENEPGVALGPYVASKVPQDAKVAVIAPDSAAGKDAVDGFRDSFGAADPRLQPTVWTLDTLTPSRRALAAAVEQALAADPVAVYGYYAGDAAVTFVKELRAAGSTAAIYAPGLLTDGAVLSRLGNEARGILTAGNYTADLNNAANHDFASVYRRTHGYTPSAAAVGSFDAAIVIDKAIRAGGVRPTPQDLYFGLGQVGQIESPRGRWQFNIVRTPLQQWYLREVRPDGQVLANVTVNNLTILG
jgi:branched-chain amino acid transport system substrate-binding protein